MVNTEELVKIQQDIISSKCSDNKVELKKNWKGYGIYANDKLKKDSVIDIYPMEIVSVYEPQNQNNSYYFDLDQIDYQGDVSYNSYKKCKKYHRDCSAMFANEPDPNQNENSTIEVICDETEEEGNICNGILIAARDIEKGDEITWCYGPDYERTYETPCLYYDYAT